MAKVDVGGGGGNPLLWFYSIWLSGQDINWDIVLSPAPVAIFVYSFIYFILLFSPSNLFYIYIYFYVHIK